jgi:hypothetical protein
MRRHASYMRKCGRIFAAGVAFGALIAGASAAIAADCSALAGKTFGSATITGSTNVSPPSSLLGSDSPASDGDQSAVLPSARRHQTVRGFGHQI